MSRDNLEVSPDLATQEESVTEKQMLGLPLGIYTNHFARGCQLNNRGVYSQDCPHSRHRSNSGIDQGIFP